MRRLTVGTRGSALALWQTRWVCARLREHFPELEIEERIIKTAGDQRTDENFGPGWPVGAFVSALEAALSDERVDFAVHSFKDLQTAETAGLTVAAVPARAPVHDVLLTNGPQRVEELPAKAKIATNSPRRAAQLRRLGVFEIVPIRGNVPTRVEKIAREGLDGTVLAAAGLQRLGIEHPHRIDLTLEQMLPAPAQGALAVQSRSADGEVRAVLAAIEDSTARRCVTAERAFLATIKAGCHTPVAAYAEVSGAGLRLTGRLYSDDLAHLAAGSEVGDDAAQLGALLAKKLMGELQAACGSG